MILQQSVLIGGDLVTTKMGDLILVHLHHTVNSKCTKSEKMSSSSCLVISQGILSSPEEIFGISKLMIPSSTTCVFK